MSPRENVPPSDDSSIGVINYGRKLPVYDLAEPFFATNFFVAKLTPKRVGLFHGRGKGERREIVKGR